MLEVTKDSGPAVAMVTCVSMAVWLEQLLLMLWVVAVGPRLLAMTDSGAFHNTRAVQGLVLKHYLCYQRQQM